MSFRTVMYHPTEAPTGRLFTDEAEFNALGPEWFDTPAKFPPTAPIDVPVDPPIVKRGWKAKEPV